jgi:hypothetical protein
MSLISPGLEGVAIGTALKSWFDMFGFIVEKGGLRGGGATF